MQQANQKLKLAFNIPLGENHMWQYTPHSRKRPACAANQNHNTPRSETFTCCATQDSQQPPSTGNAVRPPATANDASSHTHILCCQPPPLLCPMCLHMQHNRSSPGHCTHVPRLCMPAIIILRLSLRLLPPLLLGQLLLELLVGLLLQPSGAAGDDVATDSSRA